MNFLDAMLGYFWGTESFPVLIMMLCLGFFLLHFHAEESVSIKNTLSLFIVCQMGLFFSGVLFALEFVRAASVFHETFIIGSGIAAIRLWGLLVFRIVVPWFKFTPPRITEDIFVIIAYVAWGLIRMRYAGLELGGILATSAMITAVLAFSMQDTLGNILGGLALQLDNSVDVGDWIEVDDVAGKVVDIRWRSTLVETRNWETVVIPNSLLMKNKFMVLGRRTEQPVQWRRWVWFNVGLNYPPSHVISVVEEAIRRTNIVNVATQPAPNCVLMDMESTGYARYAVRYWLTDLAVDDPTDATMRWHIMTALQRAGMRLAVEERSVMNTKENEKHDEVVHQREVVLRIKTLRHVELFSQMNDEELNALAERLRFSLFSQGNIIAQQGDSRSHWLYIIINGEAEVYLELPNGGRRIVSTLMKGNFFGEMGLMTGAPRLASVIAKTDVECYRLDKEVFEEIMQARPSIADEISQILVRRRIELDHALSDINEQPAKSDLSQQGNEMLSTIKRFFSLKI